MIFNIITMAACLLMILLYRRLDRSNLKIIKLKRFSDKITNDFKKLADSESRRYNDATIEMDILIKKAGSLNSGLRESIADLESRVKGLNVEKSNFSKIEEDLKVISHAARDVNKQIEFIGASRAGFADMTKKISSLTENLARLERDASSIVHQFNDKVRERSREMSEEIAIQINRIKESVKEKEDRIISSSSEKIEGLTTNFSETLSGLEQRITNTGEAILENIKIKIETVSKTAGSLESKVESAERKVFNEINTKILSLETSVRDFETFMQEAREQFLSNSREETASLTQSIESMKGTLGEIENSIFSELKGKSNDLKKDISLSINEFTDTRDSMFQRLEIDIDKVYNKLRSVEDNVDQSRLKLISSFEEQSSRIRDELANLNIHAVSKKDEIVMATRLEAEEIKSKMEEFGEKYMEMERNIITTAEKKMEDLTGEYQGIEQRFSQLSDKLGRFEDQFSISLDTQMERARGDLSLMEDRLSSIMNEIKRYEDNQKIFSKTDEMARKVDESILHYTGILKASKEEAKNLEKFMNDIEKIKDFRKTVEKEIRIFETRKEKMSGFESEIKALMGLTDTVLGKADMLEDRGARIEQVSSRIDGLADTYRTLEKRIAELHEYDDVISKNLASITKTEFTITSIDERVKSFQKNIEKSEKKTEQLTKYLQSVEEQTLALKTKEQEIRDVKDKFTEIEGLSEHIERKIEQIYAMFQRIDTMKSEVDKTDSRLKTMYDETDKKMKQFADFIQAVETNSPIARQIKGDIPTGKNLNENTVKMVRELSGKGWSPAQISKQLLIEENSVRFIINTMSL
jgi:chromosome segregation ATPase